MQGNSKGAAAADHGAREFQPREIVKVDWKPEGQACLAEMVMDLKVRDCPHSLKRKNQVPTKRIHEYSQLTWVKILLFNTSYGLYQAKPCVLISSISETYTHNIGLWLYTYLYNYLFVLYIDT